MEVLISEFTIDEYDEVLALWRRTENVGLSSADDLSSIQRYLDRNPGMSFIARAGETIIGAVLCGHDGRRGYLHHLAVDAEYRGQGIGRALTENSLDALRAAGIEKCNIFLFQNNHDGRRFWASAGWVAREDLQVMSISL